MGITILILILAPIILETMGLNNLLIRIVRIIVIIFLEVAMTRIIKTMVLGLVLRFPIALFVIKTILLMKEGIVLCGSLECFPNLNPLIPTMVVAIMLMVVAIMLMVPKPIIGRIMTLRKIILGIISPEVDPIPTLEVVLEVVEEVVEVVLIMLCKMRLYLLRRLLTFKVEFKVIFKNHMD